MQSVAQVVARFVNAFAARLLSHWLALANLAAGLYVGMAVLAPVLMWQGHRGAADAIYAVFALLCHQLPERSVFLFGQRLAYTRDMLLQLGADISRTYVGNADIGYKSAICQRDLAIFGAALLAGLAYPLLRRRCRPLSGWALVALVTPMAIDGTGQLVGLWASSLASRTVTGILFGVAVVWAAYPRLEAALADVLPSSLR